MDPKPNTPGEANPAQNTAEPKINPLTFDEAALTEALKRMSARDAEKEQPKVETPPEEAPAIAEEQPEAPAEQPGEEVAEAPLEEPTEEPEPKPEEATDSKGVQKRIDKLTAQKKEAIERAEALERELSEAKAKLQDLESAPPAAPANESRSQFSNVWEEGKLREEYEKARNLKRWCEDHSEGTEVGGQEYTAEQIKSIRRNVEDALEIHIPQRAAFLQQFRQLKPLAEKVYPFWKDRTSPEYAEAQLALKQLPALQSLPEHQILIGDFLEGRKARLAREQAPKKPAAAPALPPKIAPKQPAAPAASGPRVDASKASFDAAKKRFLTSGSTEELAQLLKGI